jgi:TetR/AcrR family transcriptional repressor of mexCD-oprJ operon
VTVVTKGAAIQTLVASSILAAASALVAEQGDRPTMGDIATAAGIGRATLYRYYPSRHDLMHALGEAAVTETARRLDEAQIDTAPFPDALARVTQVLIDARAQYAVVERAIVRQDKRRAERLIATPIRALFARGLADGSLRADVTQAQHLELFKQVLLAANRMVADSELRPDQAAALVISMFLHGALT